MFTKIRTLPTYNNSKQQSVTNRYSRKYQKYIASIEQCTSLHQRYANQQALCGRKMKKRDKQTRQIHFKSIISFNEYNIPGNFLRTITNKINEILIIPISIFLLFYARILIFNIKVESAKDRSKLDVSNNIIFLVYECNLSQM